MDVESPPVENAENLICPSRRGASNTKALDNLVSQTIEQRQIRRWTV
ncbi:MAG: hypothetical protein OXF41_21225 [bacterium]|nr:hypothetical protein [bacterium]